MPISQFSRIPNHSTSDVNGIQEWDSTAEIKYNPEIGFYSDQYKPTGSLHATCFHVLSRTASDRRSHRMAIDQIAKEINNENPLLAQRFQTRFASRKLLGQPLTPDVLESFFNQYECYSQSPLFKKYGYNFFPKPNSIFSGASDDLRRGVTNIFSATQGPTQEAPIRNRKVTSSLQVTRHPRSDKIKTNLHSIL